MAKIVSPEKARQGPWGRPVLVILVSALILLAIGWFAVEMYGRSISTDASVNQAPATSAN